MPLVADQDAKVAFIVMMAGPGVDGAAILAEQGRLIAKAEGMSEAKVAESDALRRQMIDIVRDEKDAAAAKPKLELALARYAAAHNIQASMLESQVDAINNDWFRFFFNYDPAPALAKVKCPVLALDGSKDLQVPADLDLSPIRTALAHNPDATVLELPGLNHLFQPATTGSPSEYRKIETTIDPAALDLIAGWIEKHDGAAKRA